MATIVQQTNGEKTIYTADEYTQVQQKFNDIYNTQLPSKANKTDIPDVSGFAKQTDLNTTNTQLADIATVYASSNGTNDNTVFNNWLSSGASKILIPKGVTLKLGYTATNTYISLNNPIEIFGGGTIEFIGDFTQSDLFKVGGNNVYIHDINFTNNTGTYTTYAKGFISTLSNVDSLTVERCTFDKGAVVLNVTTHSRVHNNVFTNGFIMAFGGSNNSVTNNKISVPNQGSLTSQDISNIAWNDTSTSVGINNYIANNYLTNAYASAIVLYKYHSNTLIENNTIKAVGNNTSTNCIPISLDTVNDITVRKNDISASTYTNTYYGIECVDSYRCLIEANRVNGLMNGIIVNGTGSGLSYKNIVKHNFIDSFRNYGISVYRDTSQNSIINNHIITMSLDTTMNAYGISNLADGRSDHKRQIISDNFIDINVSTWNNTYNITGILAVTVNGQIKNNIIKITAPQNSRGIQHDVGDEGGINVGKNNNLTDNDIELTLTATTSSFGIVISHTGTNDTMTNMIVKENLIKGAPSGSELSYTTSKVGNSIVTNNFTAA